MKHTVSLSGGRTSTGPLPKAVIDKYGKENVDLIFCDTGAEHPDTYRFVRDAERELDMPITCLKLIMPKEEGKGCQYLVCTTDDIKPDYFAWKQLTSKYGNPFMPGGKFCTDQMKTQLFKKYCIDKYGKDGFYTWLGYRFEEGQRIWGKKASLVLGNLGLSNVEKTQFYLDCISGKTEKLLDDYYPNLFPDPELDKEKDIIRKALKTISDKNYRFMPEVCTFDKGDVIQWWSDKSNDLLIDAHLTNCVFCIEKPHSVVMLAIKDEPEIAKEFLDIVESPEVAHKSNRQHADDVMFRNAITFRQLYDKTQKLSRTDILMMSKMGQEIAASRPCAGGECSPFGDIHEEQHSLF